MTDAQSTGGTILPETTTGVPEWYGAAALSLSCQPIIQVFFMLVYAIWWVFAWPVAGTVVFVLALVYAGVIVAQSIANTRHSRRFPSIRTPEGDLIGKRMGTLSGVSYGVLWIAVIILALFGLWRWVLPVVALVIALHFFPMAAIFSRRIDYLLAPIALIFAVIGLVLAAQSEVPWAVVYGVTGIGGAITTAAYAGYLVAEYRALSHRAGVAR